MSREDILAVLETDMTDPGAWKSGEYLEEHVLAHAKQSLVVDRLGLVGALREWLGTRGEPRTMLAVSVAQELSLKELRPDIEILKREIVDHNIFPSFYLRDIDRALEMLED